jgi:hypothetical protein
MDWIFYIFSSTTGLVTVAGSLLLLWRGRIFLDKQTNQPTSFEVSNWIKFSSQSPVLGMLLLGVVLLIYPVYQAKNVCVNPALHKLRIPEIVTITGQVKTDVPTDLYAIVGEQKSATNTVSLTVPYISDRPYFIFRSAADGGLYSLGSITLPDTQPPHGAKYSLPDALEVQNSGTATRSLDLKSPIKMASQDQVSDFKKPEVQQP